MVACQDLTRARPESRPRHRGFGTGSELAAHLTGHLVGQQFLVETVFLHLLVKRLAGNAELFVDGLEAPAMRGESAGDEAALIGGDLVGQALRSAVAAGLLRRTVETEHETVGV